MDITVIEHHHEKIVLNGVDGHAPILMSMLSSRRINTAIDVDCVSLMVAASQRTTASGRSGTTGTVVVSSAYWVHVTANTATRRMAVAFI